MTAHTMASAAARSAALLPGVLVAFLVALPAAGQERGDEPTREEYFADCIDRSLLEYNSCLMKSADDFSRLICDLSWELQVAKCGADAIGSIRRSWRA
jgi:hypothetical protein